MKASDYIADFLAAQGVRTVYEMTGGMITFLLDSIGARSDMAIVSMHHEQSAAFAAEASARMSGIPGVALATSGPGATNLITGIGSCFYDSVPAVFITGQVNTGEQRGESGVRQAGFQETDIVAIASPITKMAVQVQSADDLPRLLALAFRTALGGRPGPVLVDVPMDVQRQDISDAPHVVSIPALESPANVPAALEELRRAERPLILAGGGVRASHSAALVQDFSELTGIPVVSTLMGLDVLEGAHPLRVGMLGTYGNRRANLAMRDADCVLVLGARLDVRQTGADVAGFRSGKTIIQVDVDSAQLAWRVSPELGILGDVHAFLAASLSQARTMQWADLREWHSLIGTPGSTWTDAEEIAPCKGINPAEFMAELSKRSVSASAIVADVGQNQMWAAQSIHLASGQRFLTSGGMGAMGFALPAAIGVAVTEPDRPVFVVVGDGGMQVNIQELETIARLGLAIKIVVLNNSCLGMVRQLQDELFESRYHSTMWGYGAPDFSSVAQAYGLAACQISAPDEVVGAVEWLASEPGKPALLEVIIDSTTCVRPKVSFGSSVFVMDEPPGAADGVGSAK